MTTIAACAVSGIMASDSHWTDTQDRGLARKVWRIRGVLWGFAGDLGEIEKVRLAIRAGTRPHGVSTVRALILSNGCLSCWDDKNGLLALREKQYAIGSGGQAARAAMAMGATPQRAVYVACQIDAGSSGRVRTYRLKAT